MEKINFPHPINPMADPKLTALINKHDAAGYGIYWRMVEMLTGTETGRLQIKRWLYEAIAGTMGVTEDFVEALLSDMINEYELFLTDGDYFWMPETATAPAEKRKATRVKTYNPDPTIYQEWLDTEKALSEDVTVRWINIKQFIEQKKPQFIEPYASAWNLFASRMKLPQVETLNDTRKKKFMSRITEEAFDFFGVLNVIKTSDFYKGLQTGSDWKVTWDYIFENEMNYVKILEKKK